MAGHAGCCHVGKTSSESLGLLTHGYSQDPKPPACSPVVPVYLGPSTAHPTPATQRGFCHLPDSSESSPRQGGPLGMKVSHPPRPRFTSRVSTAHPGMTHTTTKYTLFGNRPNIQRSASPSRQRPRACFPKRNPEKKKSTTNSWSQP